MSVNIDILIVAKSKDEAILALEEMIKEFKSGVDSIYSSGENYTADMSVFQSSTNFGAK